jgi:hypothetical protein
MVVHIPNKEIPINKEVGRINFPLSSKVIELLNKFLNFVECHLSFV